MIEQIQCPACSATIPAGSRFCSSCAHEVGRFSQMPTASYGVEPAVVRHISSDSIPAGGFTPGMIIVDRYRIIGLLGRGGMGEVYRADDLKLGQPVALKFLPRALATDPVRRERFFAEVRITRQLAHPNICRVYDIAEVDGQHFLSMEYIDGEDLASLIKRIGHLSNEKALDIFRQLASGLMAAHEKGVLHRDLKPSNIMIDGHGRVRITDFGLAIAAAEEETEAAEILGTPAYMAPEQFEGKGATTRSDIYSLGLVFYEVCTGKRAFTATTLAELRQQKVGMPPRAPSEIRQGIDPVVERLILRCIERDPRARPASVAQLAMALPGGDPLAAAIAAGETPSPELVAASGSKEGLHPAISVALLAWVIVGALLGTWLGDRDLQQRNVQMGRPPSFLIERARDILRTSGYAEGSDSNYGYFPPARPGELLVPGASNSDLTTSVFPLFWYRESPLPLAADRSNPSGSINDPPLRYPGDALVVLDSLGRLRLLRVIAPPKADVRNASAPAVSSLLSDAGFDPSDWSPVEPEMNPVFFADVRAAWRGTLKEQPNAPLRIEAAMYGGRLVSFDVINPGSSSDVLQPGSSGIRFINGVILLTLIVLFVGTIFFARRNLRLGRGDRRGAARLSFAIMFWFLFSRILTAHYEFISVPVGLERLVDVVGIALLSAGVCWSFYMALEPLVRRRWPSILVSWTRLLSGEWRDPLVGRHVFAGCALGVFQFVCLDHLLGLSVSTVNLIGLRLTNALGVSWFLSHLLESLADATIFALGILCLLAILRMVIRSDAVVFAGFVLIPIVVTTAGLIRSIINPWIFVANELIFLTLCIFVVMRYGLVALAVSMLVESILVDYPMTLQSSQWYSSASFGALAVVALIAIYGFHTSLAGRPVLSALADD
jgi:serine/threonine-protein kinase